MLRYLYRQIIPDLSEAFKTNWITVNVSMAECSETVIVKISGFNAINVTM